MFVTFGLLTIYAFLPALAFAVPAVLIPAWWVRVFWYRRTPRWAAAAAAYGAALMVVGFAYNVQFVAFVVAIPTALSALAAIELHRRLS
jgi:hypothetical protein